MTPNQLPPLPEPDTHCFDDDTGKDVWSYTADQMHAYALAALAQQAQEPVYQLQLSSGSWIDQSERQFAYNKAHEGNVVRILYTTPPSPQPAVPVVSDEQIDTATRHMYHNGRPTTKEYRVGIVRAILALRPAVGPMTLEQMADAIEHLCANREIAEILAANSADEYRAIAAKAGGGA